MSRRFDKFTGAILLPMALALGACVSRPAQTNTPVQSPEGEADASAAGLPAAVPAEAQQQFEAALALMKAGNAALASQQLAALGAQYPEFAGPLLNLGILQLRAKRYEDAESSFKAALQRDPRSVAAYNYLGIVYRNLGRFKDAESAYQQALAMDDSYALAHLNLGVLYDLYLQQPERALAEFERYLQLAPVPEPQVAGWVKELQRRTGNTKNAGDANSGASAAESNEVKS